MVPGACSYPQRSSQPQVECPKRPNILELRFYELRLDLQHLQFQSQERPRTESECPSLRPPAIPPTGRNIVPSSTWNRSVLRIGAGNFSVLRRTVGYRCRSEKRENARKLWRRKCNKPVILAETVMGKISRMNLWRNFKKRRLL